MTMMGKTSCCFRLFKLASTVLLSLIPDALHALIPEPPHLVRGTVIVNDLPRTWGSVSIRLQGSTDPLAAFPLGTLPGAQNSFLLQVPMDALEPRSAGSARQGDAAQLFLDGVAVAPVTIGERGGMQTVDLALTEPGRIVLIRGPTATPAVVDSEGQSYLFVEAAGTLGHPLIYSWTAVCPGPNNGAFDNALTRSPEWTAPATGSSPLNCTLTVSISDGQGLLLVPSTVVSVLPTVAPDPVPQILVNPDPTLCGEAMTFDGSASFHSHPERSIALYEWDFDYDGVSFDADATGATVMHGYVNRSSTVTVALRVTDDGAPPRSVLTTRVVHPGGSNRAPTAYAGGPYDLSAGGVLALDGFGSTDPDAACGDGIAAWAWDLDGDGAYDDAAEPQPQVPWFQAEALLCGGPCAYGTSYPIGLRVTDFRGAIAVAPAEVAISPLIFADDFINGTSKGDPDWLVKSGAWTVRGRLPLRYYASSPTKAGLSVAKTPVLDGLLAGGLDTRIALTGSFVSYANGAMVFGYTDNTHYRYVRLQYKRRVWKLVLGQTGTSGTVKGGAKASKTLKGLRLGRWYRIWIDIYEDGLVNVFFNERTTTPTVSYKFPAAAPGKVGYQASKARAYFDDFAAWDRGVLP